MKNKKKMGRFLTVVLSTLMISAGAIVVADFDNQEPGSGHQSIPHSNNLAPPVKIPFTVDYPHTSLLFTVADVIFFSYEDNTMVRLYDSSDTLIWNNSGVALDKGDHAHVTVSEGVYRAEGSKKFACLSGDPITNYVCGYYAMDQDGYGSSTELYTWVPRLYGHCKFIVFGYQDNTNVTVEYTDTGTDIATFTLNKGDHWDIETLSQEWIHVTADKSVSALTCYDQGYFVPSASGRWSGTEFYTYVSNVMNWGQDLSVIAYYDQTTVTIRDSDTDTLVWSGTLNSGQAHVESFSSGADQFFDITSNKNVTVSVQPWVVQTTAYHQGAYVPDRNGGGIGTNFIGSTLSGGYLHILSYEDNTSVDIYNSQSGAHVTSYSLDRGDSVQANPGNGLWKIISDKSISAYSGYGEWNADFVPVEFGAILGLSVEKTCTTHPNLLADVCETVTFEIEITNNGTNSIDALPLTDTYDTDYLSFTSASPSPGDTSDDGQLDWSDLTSYFGDVDPDESIIVTVNFESIATTSNTTDNTAKIVGAQDSEGNTIPISKGSAALDIDLIVYTPLNFSGDQKFNRSLLQGEYINYLTWDPNPNNQTECKNIIKYRIYEVENEVYNLLDEVDADTFAYWERGITVGETYTYALSAVNEGDIESTTPALVTIGGASKRAKDTQVNITTSPKSSPKYPKWKDETSREDKSIATFIKNIYSPLNFRGIKVLNHALSQADIRLTWQANSNNENIVKYRIYQIEGVNKILMAELSARTFKFKHRKIEKGKRYKYALAAVNNKNREGPLAFTEVN